MKITYIEQIPLDRYTMYERKKSLYCEKIFASGGLTYCQSVNGYVVATLDTSKIIKIEE